MEQFIYDYVKYKFKRLKLMIYICSVEQSLFLLKNIADVFNIELIHFYFSDFDYKN
jgi:hypothetical protein